jgi:hypothetical protein
MSTFVKGGGTASTPFGKREFLRSTNPKPQTESYTVAKTSVPERTVTNGDGSTSTTKILQPGTVMAKITSAAGTSTAADVGKIGPFSAQATDGRQTLANIVGLEETFLPWQLMERDVEVAVVTNCTAVQAWCTELNASGAEVVLTNTTADAMRGGKRLDINFA